MFKILRFLAFLCLVVFAFPSRLLAQTTPVFINEIHYDNAGTDTDEAIEIAGPAGTDLADWSLVLYNGNNGAVYNTRTLTGIIPDQQNGYGTLLFDYPANGIQNGAPDGVALVNSTAQVVQFLSYEGTFTAVGGPADGLTSTAITVSETGSEPAGQSLQLAETGTNYADFSWRAPAAGTYGDPNNDQVLGQVVTEPSILLSPDALAFGDVELNRPTIVAYTVTGINLSEAIVVTSTDTTFTVSADSVNFAPTAQLVPAGGRVFVRFAPTANGSDSTTITHTSGAISEVLEVTGNGYDPLLNIIPVAMARTQPVGTKVTITGRVTSADQLGSPSYVQDATGGIPVFSFSFSNAIEIGDSVIVTGPVAVFNNQVQISGSSSNPVTFTVVPGAQRVVTPKPITIDQLAANEGLLVTVQDVELVDKSFVFYPQSTEKITNGTVQADLRIDGDTDIPGLTKPQGKVDITGVVGRFNANAQLLPRSQADIPGTAIPATPADSIAKEQTFDVVTWNLEFFGATQEKYGEEFGPADEALQLQNVKRVLDSLQADVVAVQEVVDTTLFAQLVTQLPGYAFTIADRYSYSFEGFDNTFPGQKIGFIYKTGTVQPVQTRVLFAELFDAARTTNPGLLPGYPTGDPSSFWSSGRLPFLFSADVTLNGVTERINLVNLHAKSGGSNDIDRQRRAYDAQVLKDSLDAYYANEQIIILGDYNDDVDVSIVKGNTTPYQPWVSDSTDYTVITKRLSESGFRSTVGFRDMIDHITISDELRDEYIPGSETVITPFRYIRNYANTTSDHLPVIARFAFTQPLVRFIGTSDTLVEGNQAYTVQLVLSKPAQEAQNLTILLNNANGLTYGRDYTTVPAGDAGRLVLPIPAGADTVTFTINVREDQLDEQEEALTLTLQPTVGVGVGSPAAFTLVIRDNDVPAVQFAQIVAIRREGSGAYQVALPLSTAPATDQTITVKIVNGTDAVYGAGQDYTTDPDGTSGTFVVPVPAGSTTASFTVTPNADNVKERLVETILFKLDSTSSGLTLGPRLQFLFNVLDVRKKNNAWSNSFIVVPNPTFGLIKLVCKLDSYNGEAIQATLRTWSGEKQYEGSGTLQELSHQLSNQLQHSERGLYVIELLVADEIHLIKVLKI